MEIEPLILAWEQLVPLLQGCAWLTDHKGIYRVCNEAQADIFGLESKEVVGKSSNDLPLFNQHPNLKFQWEKQLKQAIQQEKPLQFELPVDGVREMPLQYQLLPLFDKGQLIGLLGTSLNDNVLPLLQQLSVHKNILDNLPEHVYWKDRHGVYLGCNLNQARDLGLENSEAIIGKTDYDFSGKQQADAFRAVDRQVIAGKKAIEAEEIIEIHGKPYVVLSRKIPLIDQKQAVIGVLGISFDISARKKMEAELLLTKDRAEAANYLMTEFISNMGHDLATPISDVGSIAQLLHFYGEAYPELKELFDTLDERAKACEAVHKTIINATSPANLDIKLETFSIASELLVLEKALRPTIGTKPLKLILRPLPSKKDDVIETDKTKFNEIMNGLLTNAINFTHEGEVTVSVFKEQDRFIIQVSDTGIGIPPDKFEYIFQQYTKLARSNTFGATFKGVGAGLYLARIRAKLLNATITVESEVGKGSTFTLSIPIHPLKGVQ